MFLITFLKIISALAAIVGVTYIIPVGVALYCGETTVILPFLVPMAISVIVMLAVNIPTKNHQMRMSIKQTFIIVAAAWIIISFIWNLNPFYII